jgi:Protein of unknown function (DUF3305)
MAFNREADKWRAPRPSAPEAKEPARGAMSLKNKASLPLGIIVERRAVDNPWIDHNWRSVAVIAGARAQSPFDAWTLVRQGDGWVQFHAGTLTLELFPKETEGYKVNLSQHPPRLYIVLRKEEEGRCDHEVVPFLVTASPYEAQDYLDSGEDQVDAVPMPDGVVAFVQDFITRHHVDEPFRKRKRKPAETGDEAFARRPFASPRRGRRGADG